jgi:hypothetical protein
MKAELQKKLFEKYPELFCQKDLPMTHTAMCWGISTGNGWFDLIDQVCNDIVEYIKTLSDSGTKVLALDYEEDYDENAFYYPQFTQVKEKFGSLRIYYVGGDDNIFNIIDKAEDKSFEICEDCGAKGKANEGGWIRVNCDSCRSGSNNES